MYGGGMYGGGMPYNGGGMWGNGMMGNGHGMMGGGNGMMQNIGWGNPPRQRWGMSYEDPNPLINQVVQVNASIPIPIPLQAQNLVPPPPPPPIPDVPRSQAELAIIASMTTTTTSPLQAPGPQVKKDPKDCKDKDPQFCTWVKNNKNCDLIYRAFCPVSCDSC